MAQAGSSRGLGRGRNAGPRRFLVHGWAEIVRPVNGYLITISKLLSYTAASLSLVWYPAIGTFLAWLVAAGVLMLLARGRLALRGGVLLAIACALVPADPEVFGLPLYAFWWTAVILFALCCWTSDDNTWRARAFLIVLSSLSSPVCLATLPLFLARAAMFRQLRAERILAAVALGAALLQLFVMWPIPKGGALTIDVAARSLPVFVGSYAVPNFTEASGWLAACGIVLLCVAALLATPQQRRWTLLFLGYLFAVSVMLSVTRVNIDAIHPALAGQRYFFLPYVVLGWIVVHILASVAKPALAVCAGLVLALSVANAVPVLWRHDDRLHWRAAMESCRQFAVFDMPVHYDGHAGRAWTVPMDGSVCAQALGAGVPLSKPSQPYRVIRFTPDSIGFACYRPPMAAVIVQDSWRGGDYDKAVAGTLSVPEDATIVGSIRTSDADTGELVVRLERGSRLWYRTGPNVTHQTIEILGHESRFTSHPVASEGWTLLEFSNRLLPDTFEVRFRDAGSGWGEWSAIAMRSR